MHKIARGEYIIGLWWTLSYDGGYSRNACWRTDMKENTYLVL